MPATRGLFFGESRPCRRKVLSLCPPAQTNQPVLVGGGHAGEQEIVFQTTSWYQSV